MSDICKQMFHFQKMRRRYGCTRCKRHQMFQLKCLSAVVFLSFCTNISTSDFIYPHFHDTTGLVFNGSAFTSSCANAEETANAGNTDTRYRVDSEQLVSKQEVKTNPKAEESTDFAVFGHRDEFVGEPTEECDIRVRLTPSEPFMIGSMWYRQPVEVYSGFECGFRFQMTDHSRKCNYVKDQSFGINQYKSCRVHGGDGFAFVIHGNELGHAALGEGGKYLGCLRNSLAVEFDTWYNPEMGDLIYDHVSVHLSGPDVYLPTASHQLGSNKQHSLADGKEHIARIRYYPTIQTDMLSKFTATPSVLPFLKDAGELKRLGTLAVWVDSMEGAPSFAIPLNLNTALSLAEGAAYIGFTSSTGQFWEKHDIMGWYCCEEPPCMTAKRIGIPLVATETTHYDNAANSPDNTVDYNSSSKNFHHPDPIVHGNNANMVSNFQRAGGLSEPHALHKEDELSSNYPTSNEETNRSQYTSNTSEAFDEQILTDSFHSHAWYEAQRAEMKQRLKDEREALNQHQLKSLTEEHTQQMADLVAVHKAILDRQREQQLLSPAVEQSILLRQKEVIKQLELFQAEQIRRHNEQTNSY
eukprot:GSMAST32.ASY1.ANO1.1437.1 assembled CDS